MEPIQRRNLNLVFRDALRHLPYWEIDLGVKVKVITCIIENQTLSMDALQQYRDEDSGDDRPQPPPLKRVQAAPPVMTTVCFQILQVS